MSDWLSSLPDLGPPAGPMPAPPHAAVAAAANHHPNHSNNHSNNNSKLNPAKHGAKKSPDQKPAADLAPTLARKRSQDFASKIQGWNAGGAGIASPGDEVVVVLDEDAKAAKPGRKKAKKAAGAKKDRKKEGDGKEEPAGPGQEEPERPAEAVEVVEGAAAQDEGVVGNDPGASSPPAHDGDAAAEPPQSPSGSGAVAPDDDASKPKEAPPATPKSPGAKPAPAAHAAGRGVHVGRQAWVRRRSKPAAELSPEVKQATTPKKRIISDGHWRRDRLSKADAAAAPPPSPGKDKDAVAATSPPPPPKPVTLRRSVVSVGLKVPPSVHDFVEDASSHAPSSRVRSTRRSRSPSAERDRAATPDYADSGVRVYIKRRPHARTLSERKDGRASESSLTAGTSSSVDKARSSFTDLTTPSPSPTADDPPRPATAPAREKSARRPSLRDGDDDARRRTRRKSKTATPETPVTASSPTPKPVAKPVAAKSPTPKPAAKPTAKPPAAKPAAKLPAKPAATPAAPPPVPPVFTNRIEGWLAGTGDPFSDRDSSLTPEPLAVPRRKSRRLDAEPRDDDDDDDKNDGRRKSSGRPRRSRPSLDRVETPRADDVSDHYPSPSATPTLQRHGARRQAHSPITDRLARAPSHSATERSASQTVSDASLRRSISRRGGAPAFAPPARRLSATASAETLSATHRPALSEDSDHRTVIPDGSVLSRASDGDEPRRRSSGLKRRMTKHSDLISVLSMPRDDAGGGGGAIKSARSIRTRRAPLAAATVAGLMNEVTADELKYQRELRTLVDGVIPVLLTYVLQKTDATGAKRLFSGSSPAGQEVTRPIVEMGVALEKLKAAHKRIPLHDAPELVRWAETAAKHYAEYLRAWRLGFQDIVVNLAPADEHEASPATGGDGERVDVAYLLKRPLVRLKYLTRTFKGIEEADPSERATATAATYHDLVQQARRRNNEERARLEDEAAASIDPTRARDPRSLAPLAGVSIDRTRSVRARDTFDMDLTHSSGQQLLCKVEVIARDDAPGRGASGDVLFCEVSIAGRWLLFPPVSAANVSARPGRDEGEIVVMVRGTLAGGHEWREIMTLASDDDATVSEWLDMLPSTPVPPKLTKTSSFNELRGPYMSGGLGDAPSVYRPPSPSEVDVPIGERASSSAQQWDGIKVNNATHDSPTPALYRAKAKRYRTNPSSPATDDPYERVHARAGRIAEEERYSGEDRPGSNNGRSRRHERSKSSYFPPRSDWTATSSTVSAPKKEYSVWLPSTDRGSDYDSDSAEEDDRPAPQSTRPGMHRRTSSVPSLDMPTIAKLRKPSQPSTPRRSNHEQRPRESDMPPPEPTSAPAKLQKRRMSFKGEPKKADATPPASNQLRPTSLGLRSGVLPSFTPAFMKRNRRSSSPLKHEYEPSTASESLSSGLSDSDDVGSITSESTADEDAAISTIGELKDFRNLGSFRQRSQPLPPKSVASETLGPSDSASQAPYRTVPPPIGQPAKTVACIFAWANRGTWESLHPEECSIVVTPGLIEAFDLAQAATAMAAADAGDAITPSQRGVKPLVALELTPLVPLRRGTALDISIRSPPTAQSLLRTSNNLMLRSRSPEECEKLYGLINRARIDNPTYIALQEARGPVATSNWAEVMDKRNAARTNSSSWLRLGSRKSSTYRSSGSRPASIAATESSVGTMNTAFSALRRFSGGNKLFNIAKSTLTSREGTRSTYSDSLSSGAATPMPIDPRMGTPLGITNAKIRLYVRETMSKWRDMGSARLTVMLPPREDPSTPADPRTTGLEKRIVICGKSKGETLVDATLGEQSFERVARTGIAISIIEESTGPNGEAIVGATGGVSNASSKIYMVQMKSERDAAYTFGLVGKLRY